MLGFLKGKIDINLDSYTVSPGESLKGTVVVSLKKPMEAKQLSIRLKAVREVTRRDHDGSRITDRETIFDFTQPLDGEKTYDTGQGGLEYPFEILIPGGPQTAAPEVGGALGQLVGLAAQVAGMGALPKWHLTARLDVKGLDVKKKVQVNVG